MLLALGCFGSSTRIDWAGGESHQLYPERPGERPPGAGIVWISPSESGAPPRSWEPVLDRLGVVWIGANRAGNRRPVADRIRLALDGASELARRFALEREHVFVAGFSGGARCASEAALHFPDVFAGGLFIGAADFHRWLSSSNPRWKSWQPSFPPPARPLLEVSRTARRFVLMTGENDRNAALVRDVYGGYRDEGFEDVTLLEIPELGHEWPPAPWFERALRALLAD